MRPQSSTLKTENLDSGSPAQLFSTPDGTLKSGMNFYQTIEVRVPISDLRNGGGRFRNGDGVGATSNSGKLM